MLLPFPRTSWDVGVLNSPIFNTFHSRVEFGTILEGLRNFEGWGLNPPNHAPVRHCLAVRRFDVATRIIRRGRTYDVLVPSELEAYS